MKVVINPSWKCQLSCPYCWLPHTKINWDAEEHTWQEWALALVEILPPGSIVDVSGGEPLLYEGLTNMLAYLGASGIRWAVTTNALHTEGVNDLIRTNPRLCAVVNVSDHSGNKAAHENIAKLKTQFPVVVHRCDHPDAGKHVGNAERIPYQPWKEGKALDEVERLCNAGVNHWVIDPGGDVFRCCVDMQVANEPLGNLFEGDVWRPSQDVFFLCDFGCSACYTTEPHAWKIEMRTI